MPIVARSWPPVRQRVDGASDEGHTVPSMDGEVRSEAPVGTAEAAAASREAFEALKAGATSAPRRKEAPRWQALAKLGVLLGLGAGVVTWALTSEETPFVYSMMVDEVAAQPAAYADRTLRVEGDLRDGSIQFREDPCEYRFTIQRNEQAMNVRFPQCVVPDTFRDGMGISVVVEGRLQDDGSFLATQVIPRCPSRYEMNQRQQNGEAMPHSMPAS
jgi:cytochrome c-type biogenesis protein CcmE